MRLPYRLTRQQTNDEPQPGCSDTHSLIVNMRLVYSTPTATANARLLTPHKYGSHTKQHGSGSGSHQHTIKTHYPTTQPLFHVLRSTRHCNSCPCPPLFRIDRNALPTVSHDFRCSRVSPLLLSLSHCSSPLTWCYPITALHHSRCSEQNERLGRRCTVGPEAYSGEDRRGQRRASSGQDGAGQ